jgi:hypothetical protein
MVKEIKKRIRLYFCPDCGAIVSCTRKQRRHPNRVCQSGKCIDYNKCRIRPVYSIAKVKGILLHPTSRKAFYRKYTVHYVQCGRCRNTESLFGSIPKNKKMTV